MAIKNYLKQYGTRKFQEGGAAPQAPSQGGAPASDPSQGGGAGAEDQLKQALTQVVQSQDPQLALQICMALAQQLGIAGASGGGAAPAPSGPPTGDPGAAPMGRYGMKVPVFEKRKV
jgi:hypothetical protein